MSVIDVKIFSYIYLIKRIILYYHFMVSDGAAALIKLAVSGLGCVSVADLFHALRALGQPFGSAIGRHISQLNHH